MPEAESIQNIDKGSADPGPKVVTWSACKAARARFTATPMSRVNNPAIADSRSIVRTFLASLRPPNAGQKAPTLSADLDRLSRVLNFVIRSVDEGILSEDEADAVINFIAGCFTQRRMDEVLSKMTMPKTGSWFAINHRSVED